MNIGNFMREANGDESSIRLLTAFIVVAVIGTWAIVSIRTNAIAVMDINSVIAALGALFAKAWQKKSEDSITKL